MNHNNSSGKEQSLEDDSKSTTLNTVSPPINNTFIRRVLTLLAYKLLRRLRPQHGVVLFASKTICIKSGSFTSLTEASTLKFIAKNTSIPVPKVHCSFVHKERTFLVLERISGVTLASVWQDLSQESKDKILVQVKDYIKELRSLNYPKTIGIANVDGGLLSDGRVPGGSPQFGPFETIQEFHRFLRAGLTREAGYEPEVDHMMELQDGPWPQPVFTHGDLSSLNILVQGDKVVGIIDWETSGWYPSYWEYTTACQVNMRNLFWREQIDLFLDPMPTELEMERVRQKYLGDT
ncbi:kinase-like protein [Microthyrium microscopicum]|uniref:Kinase-like protein n=1 Tax=Microthyrium microscopicum TaxID=703497 RepID=A0A6A6USV2_9PEZI|nr:kinase-like protein [Microthyrium microscopicum]